MLGGVDEHVLPAGGLVQPADPVVAQGCAGAHHAGAGDGRPEAADEDDGPPPPDSPNFGQPIIGPEGFYVIGHTIFATPEGRDLDLARFEWDPAGASLRLATDLTPLQKSPASISQLGPSVLMAYPDTVEARRDVGGAPLTVAMRGTFSFNAEALADMDSGDAAGWTTSGTGVAITGAFFTGPADSNGIVEIAYAI